jgi:hypothetical protein
MTFHYLLALFCAAMVFTFVMTQLYHLAAYFACVCMMACFDGVARVIRDSRDKGA